MFTRIPRRGSYLRAIALQAEARPRRLAVALDRALATRRSATQTRA